jgi:transcription termination factor Rho
MPVKKITDQPVDVKDLVGAPKAASDAVKTEVAENAMSESNSAAANVADTKNREASEVADVKADVQTDEVKAPQAEQLQDEASSEAPAPRRIHIASSQDDNSRQGGYQQHQGGYDRRGGDDRRGGYRGDDRRGTHQSAHSSGGGYRDDRRGGGYGNGGNRYEPRQQQQDVPTEVVKGFLDVQPEGHGFLRPKFIPSQRDIYISQSQIRRFMLRPGDLVEGVARPPKDTERYYGLLKVEKVNEVSAEESLSRPHFDDLTAIYPDKQLVLATGASPMSTRIIDLVAPIGLGQRGMIVSPPKAGKTTILKDIAAGISKNFPDVHLMAALIGERPEEVTDISMSVQGEVVASNFDEPPENQTRVAEITLDRAKRMVEQGKDVVILLDSITRLARAYNLTVDSSGRTLSGGFDPAALWPAKKFFGAARNCREGGSLTIIGTALVETGSRMDDLIYEEFKGTGNMELHLDRKLAERRIFPAINIERSGTRGEERILPEADYKKIVTMRRMMDMLGDDERTSRLVEQMAKTDSNEAFLEVLGKAA